MVLVKKQHNEIKNLEQEISRIKKPGQASASNPPTLCINCKKKGYHQPQDCYELAKNKDKRPPGWRSALWRWGTESTNKLRKSNNNPLTHTSNFSPTLTTSQYKSSIQATSIIDSRATDIYFSTDAPMVNIDRSAPKVTVGTATGQTQSSAGTGELNLPKLPYDFPVTGHIMPGFKHTLIGVGPLWDADCTVPFTRADVIVRESQGSPVLTGWREQSGPRLWIISLQPGKSNLPHMPHDANRTTLKAYSAYDLPRVKALIRYFRAEAGYPVRSTWLKAIGAGNYSTWPGLTLNNATKYCPSTTAAILGHLVQKRQGVRSTKTKVPTTSPQ